MAKKKPPKLLTYIKKKPHQKDFWSGSATIDLEAQKKAGLTIEPKKGEPGIRHYALKKTLPPLKKPRQGQLFSYALAPLESKATLSKGKPNPNRSTKKAIWIEGYKDIKDFDAVSSTLDQIWSDVTGTYRPEDVEIWYGGYKGSDTDMEIELWSEKKGIKTRAITPYDKIFNQSGTDKEKIQRRGAALKKLEAQGAKGGKEGRQLLNMYNINDVGEITYNYADTSRWWDRYSELQTQYGKGNTAKVVQAYLDEVEDIKHGSTLKNPNITSSLAALEVLEDKNKYYRQNAEDYNQMLIDEGHYDPSGTPEAKAFNAKQATEELIEGTGYYKKPKVIKDLYSEAAKNRIANIRGDVSHPLKTFESIQTDRPDSPGIEEGTKHVVDEGTFDMGPKSWVDKGEGEFKSQKVIMGKDKHGKDIIETFHSKRIEKNRVNKNSLSVPKGQEIVDFSRRKLPKNAPVQKIISELINRQTEDFGYSGTNVFGDFAETLAKKEEKKQLYEGKEGTQGSHTEDFNEGYESNQVKNAIQQQQTLDAEIEGLDAIKRRQLAAKNLSNFYSGAKREFQAKTLPKEIKKLGDVDAPKVVTTLGTSWSRDPDKKRSSTTKVIQSVKNYHRTQSEIKKSLPSEMKEINKNLNKDFKKYPKEKTIATTTKPSLPPRHPVDSSKPFTDHRPRARNRYVRVPYEGEKIVPHIEPGERGVISRAYVSEPSLASESDIRKALNEQYGLRTIASRTKIDMSKQATTTGVPEGETIKMTKSKRTGTWGTPSEHRKNAVKAVAKKAKDLRIKKHVQNRKISGWGKISRLSVLLAPAFALSSLHSKKAKASVKNIAQETTSVLIGSERVFSSVGSKNKGYVQKVDWGTKGVGGGRRPVKPIEGAGGPNTPYASIMRFFSPSTNNAWKNRKRTRRN